MPASTEYKSSVAFIEVGNDYVAVDTLTDLSEMNRLMGTIHLGK